MTRRQILQILGKTEKELIKEFASYINECGNVSSEDYVTEFGDALYDGVAADFGGREQHSIKEWSRVRKGIEKILNHIEPEATSLAEEMSRNAAEEEREFLEARQGRY